MPIELYQKLFWGEASPHPKTMSHCIRLIVLRRVGLIGFVCFWMQPLSGAIAQIVPDSTLPQGTQITIQGATLEITGGTQAGNNLFHSFGQFSVPVGQIAFFNNNNAIANIINRVTGPAPSQIDGLIRANGTANVFLINPNGIVFGANAALDIGGSFMGSTANRLEFADGAVLPADAGQTPPLLSVSVPVGLQFGAPFSDTVAAPIQVQGNGSGLFLEPDFSVNRSNRPVGVQVNTGQALALLGGEVQVQGGNLTAMAGRIALGAVGSGRVGLRLAPAGWQFDYRAVDLFQDITLSRAASLEVSGDSGGEIELQGRSLNILEASALLADTLGNGVGGRLNLTGRDRIQIAGFQFNGTDPPFVSRLSTDVVAGAAGTGGIVAIATPQLEVFEGGQVSSGTFGTGNAGLLQVRADRVGLRGGSPVGPSGLFVPVGPFASGNGGNLVLVGDRLQITDRAQIAASTFGDGNAGTLTIQMNQVDFQGDQSGLFTTVNRGASGNGGALTLITNGLRLSDGAQISTLTGGAGDAGSLTVQANTVELLGTTAEGFPSGLLASVEPGATGDGGNLTIVGDRLQIGGGAQISTSTFGSGAAGNLTIQVNDVTVRGGTDVLPSAILAVSDGSGDGGTVRVEGDRLRLLEGGQIATATAGNGNAGSLIITTSDGVELAGRTEFGSSGLFASAVGGMGAGGNIEVTTGELVVRDGAIVSVSNFPSPGSERQPGMGSVGNVLITADQIALNQGLLTADSNAGDRGNITLQSDRLILRQQSNVNTNALGDATGGNINITTELLVAVENSDITANAQNNFGGSITLTAEAVLGTQPRPQLTPTSDITAASALGIRFSGTVTVNTPDGEAEQLLPQLPTVPIDVTQQIAAVCTETEGNQFVVTGLGGLPEAPTELMQGVTLWDDGRAISGLGEGIPRRRGDRPSPQRSVGTSGNAESAPVVVRFSGVFPLQRPDGAVRLVEAQGFGVDGAGRVVLVAQGQTGTGNQRSPACGANFAGGQSS